ncbi:MerR family transcriptional regulator [Mycoplasma sp. P36-A1]|uniref:MerR family transcriptional regulator n=1 Tax=Mycoplasma sp. P36-A1 TaxID=3252900 RepID=UPI003C2FF008
MNIKQVSLITNLSNDTIRYYEKEGIIMPVERNSNGIRNFNQRNINQLNFAKIMRKAGMKIENLKEYVALVYENDSKTVEQRKIILKKQAKIINENIEELQQTYNYLMYKIDNYDTHMKDAVDNLNK